MANRFPLIGNSVTKRLEELAATDNLNLSESGIYDGTGVGNPGQILYSTGEGIEWANVPVEIDTTYSISAEDGSSGKKIIRLTDVNFVTDDVTLAPGTNISLTRSGDEITINATYVDTDTITSIKGGVAGSFVTGEVSLLPTGSVFITQVGNNITIGASDTNTITRIKGGSSGSFVTGDVTITASGASSVNQAGNTVNVSSTDTVTRLKASGAGGTFTTGDITLAGGGAASITQSGSTITVNAPNTTYGLNVTDTSTTVKTISLAGSDNTSVDVTLTAGPGVVLTVDNNDIEFSVNVSTIDINDLGDVTITDPVNNHSLKYLNGSWINGFVSYTDLTNAPALATVATSGSYSDLLNLPDLQPVATSGSYNDLDDLPVLVTDASDLTDTTNRFFSGDYSDLLNAPALADVATSGDYSDLLSLPDLKPVATSGLYSDLTDLPTIPPNREYIISAETDTSGAKIRLRENNSLTDDDLVLVSGTGITVSRTNENTINIATTVSGLPSGLTATASSLVFEGSTVDAFKTTVQVANPTANRTLTLPNLNGTIIVDSTNKTYTMDVSETDTRFYEGKIGLLGSNTGGTTYAIVSGVGGLKVDTDSVTGSQQSASIGGLTITPPPAVHVGTSAPAWAKDGDLWYNNTTGVLRIFDESLYPTPDAIVDYFQAVDLGDSRFFCDRNPLIYIPTDNQFIVGPGIPSGAFVSSRFDPQTGNNVGWFNLNTPVTTNIPHNAKLRVYSTNPNVNISTIWRTLYQPQPQKQLQSRTTSTVTTPLLGQDESANITLTGFKSYALLKVQTNNSAWVRLYTSSTARDNDSGRNYGDPIPENAGVVCDVTTISNQVLSITPSLVGFSDEDTTIFATIVNKSSSNTTITTTLTILKLED